MPYPKWKPKSEESKQKARQKMLWHKKSSSTIINMSKAALKKWSNKEYRQMKMNTVCKWKNHPFRNWWITPLTKQIRRCFMYRQWRSDVFTRDDFTCVYCWTRWWYIQADHIKYFSTIMKENNILTLEDAQWCEELWNINNWQTLCYNCHRKKTKIDAKILKSNKQHGERK